MINIQKYAAIDIGSNAVRLLISNIIEKKGGVTKFKKSALVRVPIRLGADVFLKGKIGKENRKRLLDTMEAFKLLMASHKVIKYKACATSAMREAKNGDDLVQTILKKTGVKIDIIGGEEEATIIAATDLNSFIDNNKTYLYVDVGGGSTEFSIIHNGNKVTSSSYKIGTVRVLNGTDKKNDWKHLEEWIKTITKKYDKIDVIGSGGNINKIFKLSGKSSGSPLTYFYLASYLETLKKYTYEERIYELDLNHDRADVIIPALKIYLSAMKWSNAEHMYVPKIGLSDGIIKSIYNETISSYTEFK